MKDRLTIRIIFAGNAEVVKVLVENGADVNVADDLDRTPLSWAIKNDDATIATILLKNGVDLNAVHMGWKSLHLATSYGEEKKTSYSMGIVLKTE